MAAYSEKQLAAKAAVDLVEPGMVLGLGTGSTADAFVRFLSERVARGLEITGVATSERTAELARSLKIPLSTLDEHPVLDLTVDGTDEFDPHLNLIKGGGGALLHEKIIAAASRDMVVIADKSKQVQTLGAFPLPVEITPFGQKASVNLIAEVAQDHGCKGTIRLRMAGAGAFHTDGGNVIYDCAFGSIPDPAALASGLNAIPGVVEHGLFIGLAGRVIMARGQDVEVIQK